MYPKVLNHSVTHTQSYKPLPHPSGLQWSEVVPRLARLASTQSVPSLNMIEMDECHMIMSWHYTQGLTLMRKHQQWNPGAHSDWLHLCTWIQLAAPSSHSRHSSRSADVSTNTFCENPKYVNRAMTTLHNHHWIQPDTLEAARHNRQETQMAFIDGNLWHTMDMLNRVHLPKHQRSASSHTPSTPLPVAAPNLQEATLQQIAKKSEQDQTQAVYKGEEASTFCGSSNKDATS